MQKTQSSLPTLLWKNHFPLKSTVQQAAHQALRTNAEECGSSKTLRSATRTPQGCFTGERKVPCPGSHGKVMADPTPEQSLPAPPTVAPGPPRSLGPSPMGEVTTTFHKEVRQRDINTPTACQPQALRDDTHLNTLQHSEFQDAP